jgi:hypothetical protein
MSACCWCKKEKNTIKLRLIHEESTNPMCDECFEYAEPILKLLVRPDLHVAYIPQRR